VITSALFLADNEPTSVVRGSDICHVAAAVGHRGIASRGMGMEMGGLALCRCLTWEESYAREYVIAAQTSSVSL
jgi:hypothetical protein